MNKITRKQAKQVEAELKAMGVYKPYVSQMQTSGCLSIESYPLDVRVSAEMVDPEHGPYETLTMYDYAGIKSVAIATERCYIGSPVIARAARMLLSAHADAYARAQSQGLAVLTPTRRTP